MPECSAAIDAKLPVADPIDLRRFQGEAEQMERELQLYLPLKEVAAALQDGVGHLMRQAGLDLMQTVMDLEVAQLAGGRYQRCEGEQAYRWGSR